VKSLESKGKSPEKAKSIAAAIAFDIARKSK
jgi:hypothetical protein